MTLAVIDQYRLERKDLFVDIDNVVSLSMERVRRWQGSKKAYTAAEVIQDKPVPGAADALRRLRTDYFIRFLTARGSYEDPFNVTQTWLDLNGFEYDELLVVDGPEAKVAHLSTQSILVDDFTLGHEKEDAFTGN
ncbi:Coenzyme gamma-F420-2:alpha-L-glutamate ligase [Durusdinium trenchii]|uniref:Coenzyme gamma-F420-2:alpha-L-glutamate ligase n=1 Tax=Durusdinium trenchii TaxID=1381693 RepID=A0ABP0Q7P5_9DINO